MSQFEKIIEIREGRWNDYCQSYEDSGCYKHHEDEDRNDSLYFNGILVAEFKDFRLHVYTKEFYDEIMSTILQTEKDLDIRLTHFLSDELFEGMSNHALLERYSILEWRANNPYARRDEKYNSRFFYGLAEKAKTIILKRMGDNNNDN